jgi:osmotically-inducible protein OsmY
MNCRTTIQAFLFTSTLLINSALVVAQEPAGQKPSPAVEKNKGNKRVQSTTGPTADQQGESRSDRELTRRIRQAIIADHSLSTYAHNVTIIAQHGVVTLKGTVASEQEKRTVEAKAIEGAGENKVTSDLQVIPKK